MDPTQAITKASANFNHISMVPSEFSQRFSRPARKVIKRVEVYNNYFTAVNILTASEAIPVS